MFRQIIKAVLILVFINTSCNPIKKEFLDWEGKVIREFGLYHYDYFSISAYEHEGYLYLKYFSKKNDCNLIVFGDVASAYQKFRVFYKNSTFWIYSSDVGYFRVSINTDCNSEFVKISEKDIQPSVVNKIKSK